MAAAGKRWQRGGSCTTERSKLSAVQAVVGHVPHSQLIEDLGAVLSSQPVHWAVNTFFRSHFDCGRSSDRLLDRALEGAFDCEAGEPRAAASWTDVDDVTVARLSGLSVADGAATAASVEATRSVQSDDDSAVQPSDRAGGFCLLAALDDDLLLHVFAVVW
jgi:hypothetical protein